MVWLHHGHVVSSNRAPEAALPLFIGKVLCSLLIASGMICYLASSSFGVSVGCKVLLSTVFSSFPAVACRSTFCTQNGLPKYAALLCLHFFWDNTRSHPPFLNPWGKYLIIKKFSPPPRGPNNYSTWTHFPEIRGCCLGWGWYNLQTAGGNPFFRSFGCISDQVRHNLGRIWADLRQRGSLQIFQS